MTQRCGYTLRTGDQQTTGRIVSSANTPRSYLVDTPQGQIRRTRSHITPMPNSNEMDTNEQSTNPSPSPIMTRSRTGAMITQLNNCVSQLQCLVTQERVVQVAHFAVRGCEGSPNGATLTPAYRSCSYFPWRYDHSVLMTGPLSSISEPAHHYDSDFCM